MKLRFRQLFPVRETISSIRYTLLHDGLVKSPIYFVVGLYIDPFPEPIRNSNYTFYETVSTWVLSICWYLHSR
jgi:hypothetical protein